MTCDKRFWKAFLKKVASETCLGKQAAELDPEDQRKQGPAQT